MSGVIKVETFRSEGDWINEQLTKYGTNQDGKVSIDRLKAIAKENGLTHQSDYPNPGMWRMAIGNMLRAKARYCRHKMAVHRARHRI